VAGARSELYLLSGGNLLISCINTRITDEGVTAGQKQLLVTGATQPLVDILGK